MLILSKFLTQFFFPPGVFVLLLFLLLFLSYRVQRKTARVWLIAITLLLYLLSIDPIAQLLLSPLERVYPPLSLEEAEAENMEAIVVLGNGLILGSPDEKSSLSPTAPALKRLLQAYRIHKRTGLPIVPTGGSPLGCSSAADGDETTVKTEEPTQTDAKARTVQPTDEATAAANYLTSLGMRPDLIIPEPDSRNTYENAANVAGKFGYESIILVTSAYHMPRSVWIFEKIGVQVLPAPTDYGISREGLSVWSFLPDMNALHWSYRALHEYFTAFIHSY